MNESVLSEYRDEINYTAKTPREERLEKIILDLIQVTNFTADRTPAIMERIKAEGIGG
jgi:hypothetical protein